MESISLNNTLARNAFFAKTILTNTQYWQTWLNVKAADAAALDREQKGIIKAITFALNLQDAWILVCQLIIDFSPYIERRGHWDVWGQVLKRAVASARQSKNASVETELTILLARLHFQQGRFKETISGYRQVIRLARRNGDLRNEARACSNLGYLYIDQGHWQRAEVLCRHALNIFEQINNNHGRAHTHNHLGILYIRQRRWDDAEDHLEQSLAVWQRMDDKHGMMRAYINLGNFYNTFERLKKTLFYLEKAFHLSHITGEEVETAKILNNMAIAYRVNGSLQQAEEHAFQAKAIYQRFSNSRGLAIVACNLGAIYLDQQKWQEAKRHQEACLEQARQVCDKFIEIVALIGLVQYELARKKQRNALTRLEILDAFINQNPQFKSYRDWHTSLMAECRSLSEESKQTATD